MVEDSKSVIEALNRIAVAQEKLVEIAEADREWRKQNQKKVDEQMKQREKALNMMDKLDIDPDTLNQSMKQVAEMMGSYKDERDEFNRKLGKK